jgi:hypothetical protein
LTVGGVITLGSFRSAAVTTSALALCRTWPEERSVLLVEVDPSGGTLAATMGFRPEPGLQSLAADARRGLGVGALDQHAQLLSAQTSVLLGPPAAEQVRAALAMVGELPALVRGEEHDVVCDCGRLDPASPVLSLFGSADLALLVVRGELADLDVLVASMERRSLDRSHLGDRLGLLLLASGPYGAAEVEEAVGVPVVGTLPFDPGGVQAIVSESPRPFALRSALPRAARTLAAAIVERLAINERPADGLASLNSISDPVDQDRPTEPDPVAEVAR